jgi:hypothetical protein
MKTLERFMKLVKSGGTMWSVASCAPLRISPRDREGRSKLNEVSSAGTWEADGYLQPVFFDFSLVTQFAEHDGGGWGSSMGHLHVYMGRELVVLGDRLLVFEKSKCAP